MLAKNLLLNKNMFVLIVDERKVMVLFKVMWFLTLAVDMKQK